MLNDYFDLEVDKVNTPGRPLPMGTISPAEAILLAGITICLGLAASLAINISAFILCIVLVLVSCLYNWKFKETGLGGNLMVSFCVASTFILGGMAVGGVRNAVVWTFALMAFFFDLGEEIAGDAMDVEGDKKRSSRSIAIRRGKDFALMVSSSLFSLVVLLSLLPIIFQWLGTSYLVMIIVSDLTIVTFTIKLLKSKTPDEGRRSMRRICLGVLLGVLAFIIGKFFE